MDSVQKNSEIKNFCTEFLLFAYLAKIKHFYNTKLPAFVFFHRYWRFKYKKIRRDLQGIFTIDFYISFLQSLTVTAIYHKMNSKNV